MATTTTESKVEVLRPYPESDKIGPLGSKRSVFDDEAELRRTLVAEFQAAADAARVAAASVDRDAHAAVHEYRKALRRARAVVALVAEALPRSEHRALTRALREARRALGTARDQAVAPEAIAEAPLDDDQRETARAIAGAAGEAAPPRDEIKQLLAEGAARTAAQVEALEAALPPTIAWKSVERGVRDVYDKARRARKRAKRSRRAFHTWRRRSKELGYQLEILAGYAGERTAALQHELDAVADLQRSAVDLFMLRELVRTHSAGMAAESIDRLVDSIDSRLDELVGDARRSGKSAFRRKPRRFARKVTKAVRRDLAPAPVVDDIATD